MTPPIDIENLNVPEAEIPGTKSTKSLWIIVLSLLLTTVIALFGYLMSAKNNELRNTQADNKSLREELATVRLESKSEIAKKDSIIFYLQNDKYQSVLDILNVKPAKTKIEIQNPTQ